MSTLASIPEAPTRRSAIGLTAPRVTAFQRSRPRSRVVVLSRKPSRWFQRNRHTVASTNHPNYEEGATQTDQNAGKPDTATLPAFSWEDCVPRVSLADELISPLNSAASSAVNPSEPSVDLESFPVPPNHEKGWPLPDERPKPVALGLPKVDYSTSPSHSKLSPKSRPAQARSDVPNDSPRQRRGPGQRQGDMKPGEVEAIAQDIAEQFQRFSFSARKLVRPPSTKPSVQSKLSGRKTSRLSSIMSSVPSRTPSEREELKRFSKQLQEYADKVGAKGKIPVFTPTPCVSPATFRTISALLPYRSEFRAAGLAVTSRDQAQITGMARQKAKKPVGKRRKRMTPEPQKSHVSQLDGKQESSTNPSAVIEFAGDKTAESWRHVLIDGPPVIPPRKHSLIPGNTNASSSRCFPCFSRKPNPRINAKSPGHQHTIKSPPPETKQADLSVVTDQLNPSSRPNRQGTPNPWRHQSTSHSRDPVRVPDDLPRSRMNSAATAPVGPPRRPVGLRRRSMVYGQVQVRREPRATGKRRMQPRNNDNRKKPSVPRHSIGEAPLDLIPQVSSKLNLHRFAERQYQSLPMPPNDMRRRHDSSGISGPPSVANSRRPRRVTAGGASVSGDIPARPFKTKMPPNKAALAAQEIARHDLGPYPIGIPKPRKRSVLLDPASDIPRRSMPFRQRRRPAQENRVIDEVNDRDVLEGLRVATSAACDEALDRLVHKKTGVHIRNFLAGLVSLDTFSSGQHSPKDEERVRKRRSQIRQLKQQLRRSQEARQRSSRLT